MRKTQSRHSELMFKEERYADDAWMQGVSDSESPKKCREFNWLGFCLWEIAGQARNDG